MSVFGIPRIFINMNKKENYINTKANAEEKAMNWLMKKTPGMTYERESYEYSAFDGVMTQDNTKYLTEIKVRKKYSYEVMMTLGGPMLEFKKLRNIVKWREMNNNYDPVRYLVFFKDRLVIYNLNMDPNSYNWQMIYGNDNDYDRNKIWKFVHYLQENQIIKTIKY